MRIAKTDDIINRFIMDIYDARRKIGGLEVELGTNGHVMYDHSRVVPGALKRLAQAGFEIVRKGEPAKAPSTAGDILRNALHEANELGRAPSPGKRFHHGTATTALVNQLAQAGFEITEKLTGPILNGANENRWEVGIRNIVTHLHGPTHPFEIDDIVEEVRALRDLAAGKTKPALAAGKINKAPAGEPATPEASPAAIAMAAYGRGIHNTIMNRAIDPRAKAEGNHDEPPQPPLDLRSPRRRGARVRTGAPPDHADHRGGRR